MRACGAPGRADGADDLPRFDLVAGFHVDPRQMEERAFKPLSVVDKSAAILVIGAANPVDSGASVEAS